MKRNIYWAPGALAPAAVRQMSRFILAYFLPCPSISTWPKTPSDQQPRCTNSLTYGIYTRVCLYLQPIDLVASQLSLDGILRQEIAHDERGTDRLRLVKFILRKTCTYILFSSRLIVKEKQHFMVGSFEPSTGFFRQQLVKSAFWFWSKAITPNFSQ
jgi:hypothetical protein